MIQIPVIKSAITITAFSATGLGSSMLSDAITGETPITLGEAIGVGVTIILLALYIGRWQQKIEDRLREQDRSLGELSEAIRRLPCSDDCKHYEHRK
jgi:ABC-type proline/glycine betaine transport system permease subunit